MILPVRLNLCFFFLLYFFFSSHELSASDDKVIRQIAARNFAHFLLLKSLGLLNGPFFLAIDGPPGVGKSSLADPLKEFLVKAVGSAGKTLNVGTFRQDAFLRSRADRVEAFSPEHGKEGVSGNCDGREYRWQAMKACVENVHCGGEFWGYVYRPGQVPDLQGPERFNYADLDILIFEGTHSTGNDLYPFMHATVYLGAEDDMIRFNRLERGVVREGRDWGRCQAMADVAELQYPQSIHPNSQRTQYLFELVPDRPLPQLNESLRHNWPEVSRSPSVCYNPFSHRIELSQEQQQAMERLQQSGALRSVDGRLDETIFAAPAFFWEQLTDLFQTSGYQLTIPARDNACFFNSLANAYSLLGIRDRDDAVALLRQLQQQSQMELLNEVQQHVIDDVNAILSLEIEFISNPRHWGGFTTLMYLWQPCWGQITRQQGIFI